MYHMVQVEYVPAGTYSTSFEEAPVRGRDVALLLGFGLLFWTAGTLWYERRGPLVFETTAIRYWINFVLTPVLTAGICLLVLRWRRVPSHEWTSAMLLIAIPGMLGEAVLLSNFSALMPGMREASAGKYGAFLFVTYALVLGIAEVVTLRAAR
jgi:hypothetical protein